MEHKKLTFPLILLLITPIYGCTPTIPNTQENNIKNLPDELKDCKFYDVDPGNFDKILHIARCPNSTTSTNYVVHKGKAVMPVTTIVIDGITYKKAEKQQ